MKTVFEILPDEIILLICQYLSSKEIIRAFMDLNFRLNCTISGYTSYWTVSDPDDKPTFELIRNELRSLTVKNSLLTNDEIRTAINIEELNLIRTLPMNLTNFEYLTDLNIHFIPVFPSLLTLYSRNTHLHSIYLESNQSLTIPEFDPSKISSIKQLAIHVDSATSFLRILRTCPELTCLNLALDQFVLNDSNLDFSSIKKPEHLSIFSVRFSFDYNIDFNSLKLLLNCLPSTLEYLSVTIQTNDKTCLDGSAWETFIQQTFSQLIRLEFFITFKLDRYRLTTVSDPALSPVLKTFENSFWSTIVPQTISGYRDHFVLCIHTKPIPLVARRRYFLN